MSDTTKRSPVIQKIMDYAKRHGENDDPDHEVGDLQDALDIIDGFLTDRQREWIMINIKAEWGNNLDWRDDGEEEQEEEKQAEVGGG